MKKGSGQFWYTTSTGKRKRKKAGIKREYQKFQSSTSAKKDRAARNSARRSAIRKGRVRVHDGKVIDHIHGVKAGNGSSNLRVLSKSKNAGRKEKSRLKGSKRDKSTWGK